jgi:hypothetical protein
MVIQTFGVQCGLRHEAKSLRESLKNVVTRQGQAVGGDAPLWQVVYKVFKLIRGQQNEGHLKHLRQEKSIF